MSFVGAFRMCAGGVSEEYSFAARIALPHATYALFDFGAVAR